MDNDELIAFIRARLNEDEKTARRHDSSADDLTYELAARCEANYPCTPYLQISQERALADIDSKRRILRELPTRNWHEPCDALVSLILTYLALPYRDHPNYKADWEPGDWPEVTR